ncbi:ubiquitin fusion degradation protein [Histomonas meleagridis]|uniref:ubiquitin fusion degradation protein n=1 Tax=Histomonas meleagridis TaxID=135588 RepID=UPI00355A91C8|nr:ubiquitin fusion degradation protein [Histomonas meleagridis]KAH0801738.1 ubiquitin fusion degradation protein [Histomonas meleagridis]
MTFNDNFRCKCVLSIRPELEQSARILLPESVLDTIMQRNQHISVMFFAIRNTALGISVYAGVDSFTAQQGTVFIPFWMMEYLQVNEDNTVRVSLTSLVPATRALFQPQDDAFLNLPNPRVILEYSLRQHPCLTQGTILNIEFNNKIYRLKVLKTEPKSAVQILHADVICDFATPVNQFDHKWNEPDTDSSDEELNQKVQVGRTLRGETFTTKPTPIHSTFEKREAERRRGNKFTVTRIEDGREILPPKPKEKKTKPKNPEEKFNAYGPGHIIKVKKGKKQPQSQSQPTPTPAPQPVKPQPEPKEEKKNPFSGSARTLSGAPVLPKVIPKPTMRPVVEEKKNPQQEKKEEKKVEKKDYFKGTPRSLK